MRGVMQCRVDPRGHVPNLGVVYWCKVVPTARNIEYNDREPMTASVAPDKSVVTEKFGRNFDSLFFEKNLCADSVKKKIELV